MKSTTGKPPYELLPPEALEEVVMAMKHGADKHAKDDWRQGRGMPWSWLIAAAARHTFALLRGQDLDPDSGLHHGAHLACCGLMLIYYFKNKKVFDQDDRFKPPPATVTVTRPHSIADQIFPCDDCESTECIINGCKRGKS